MQYTQEELKEILEKHHKWLNNKSGGQRANLEDANLESANLKYANLKCANLEDANLEYANLESANLEDVNLKYANLTDAKLNRTNAEGITGYTVYAVQMPTSRNNARLSYWKGLGIWTTGCFQGSKKELLEVVNETHAENEKIRNRYLKAIEFIEEMEKDE